MKDLKREIERLKENKDAIKENETLKKEIESLKKEMAELKRAKDENNRKCDKCIEDLGQEENLREHILSKHAPKQFKCNVCGDMLRTESCMKKHEKSVHAANSKREKLSKHLEELQSKIADQKIGILKDILALQQKERKYIGKCNCKAKFCNINHSRFRWTSSRSGNLLKKMNEVVDEKQSDKNILVMEKCDKTFPNKDGMKSHVENKHSKDFYCKQCKNGFTDHESLIEHIHTHHEQENTSKDSILKSFSYDCDMCENVFDDSGDLSKHIALHHVDKCTDCGHEFYDEIALQKHKETEHGKIMNCHQCEDILKTQEELDSHMMTHQQRSLMESTFFNPSLDNMN